MGPHRAAPGSPTSSPRPMCRFAPDRFRRRRPSSDSPARAPGSIGRPDRVGPPHQLAQRLPQMVGQDRRASAGAVHVQLLDRRARCEVCDPRAALGLQALVHLDGTIAGRIAREPGSEVRRRLAPGRQGTQVPRKQRHDRVHLELPANAKVKSAALPKRCLWNASTWSSVTASTCATVGTRSRYSPPSFTATPCPRTPPADCSRGPSGTRSCASGAPRTVRIARGLREREIGELERRLDILQAARCPETPCV